MRRSPREWDGACQTEEARGDRSTMWGRSGEAAAEQEEEPASTLNVDVSASGTVRNHCCRSPICGPGHSSLAHLDRCCTGKADRCLLGQKVLSQLPEHLLATNQGPCVTDTLHVSGVCSGVSVTLPFTEPETEDERGRRSQTRPPANAGLLVWGRLGFCLRGPHAPSELGVAQNSAPRLVQPSLPLAAARPASQERPVGAETAA